jgi:hypothetical protein
MTARSKTLRKIFQILFFLLFSSAFSNQPASDQVTRDVMVVCLKLSPPFCSSVESCTPSFPQALQDTILTPRRSPSSYEISLNYTMSNFIREATYSQSNVTFKAIENPDSTDGWFDAPHMLEDYNNPNGKLPPEPKEFMGQDALALAQSVIGDEVQQYEVLMVITNIQSQYGFTTGLGQYALVVVGEHFDDESFMEVVGHEFGHVHGLHHVVMGPYDIVGNSDVLTHYGGWSKWYTDWIPEVAEMPCIGGTCGITTVLDPLARAGKNVLQIPFTNLPGKQFVGYFAECRAKIGFDEKIPEAGVIITRIENVDNPEHAAHIVFPLGGNDYTDAALSPGETFVDNVQKITITYLSKDGVNRCTVKAERGEINAPDPMIKAGIEEPSIAGYINYGSRDIWIDSQENGWDVYPHGTSFSLEGSHRVPSGYGDPFWVDHENRIKFLVRNRGYGPAEKVTVDVYVTQPLTIYIPGITCDGPELNSADKIDTVVIDRLEKGEIYMGSVSYTPTSSAAAQVTVVIRDYMGEITHANNRAAETYASQHVLADFLVSQDMQLMINTYDEGIGPILVQADGACMDHFPYRFVRKVISAIDRKYWITNFDQIAGEINPSGQTEIPIASLPPSEAQPGDCEETLFEVQAFMGDTYVPVDGFRVRACVAESSTLTCSTPKGLLDPNTNVEITGELVPAVSDAIIALEFTSPKGESLIRNTAVKKNGNYELGFLPEEYGKWQVRAFWQGSNASMPAKSEPCNFEVKSPKPEFTINHNINCRLGPGTDYPVVTSGRIGDVIPVEGRSKDALWLYGTMKGTKCWMSLELGDLNVYPWSLPEKQSPQKPKPTVSVCSRYTTEIDCKRLKDECQWLIQPTGTEACVPK